ncbi:biotin transporter BioY [Brevundimonas sp.]|uniref:biotin transporter BioY n=1 Tax=Brevundimonas sp. TaxID=1871086 RepID=UPI003519A821
MTPSPVVRHLPGLVATLAFVALIVLGARVDVAVPGSPVPQSLQTLAVLAAGLTLGPRSGLAAGLLYLAAGALGLPVFAGGASGLSALTGPTAGYLVGFPLAALLVGAGGRTLSPGPMWRTMLRVFALGLAGHLLILALGWAGLSLRIGAAEALSAGVTPFLWGMAVKSAALALIAPQLTRLRDRLNI